MRKGRDVRGGRSPSTISPTSESARELDQLLAGTLKMIDRERGVRAWLRSRSTRVRLALGVLGLFSLCALQLLLGRRVDLSIYPAWRMGLTVGVLAGGVRALLRIHLRSLAAPPLPPVVPRAMVAVFLAITVVLAAAPRAHAGHEASLIGDGADFAARAAACFVYGLVASAPFALLCWALRPADATTWRSQLVPAAASALVANLLLQLHCPITSPQHLLAGHAAVALAWMLIYTGIAWGSKGRLAPR